MNTIYDSMAEYYFYIINEDFNNLYNEGERKREVDEIILKVQGLFGYNRILELASGGGFWTKHLAKSSQLVVAADLNLTEVRKIGKDFSNVIPIRIDLMKDDDLIKKVIEEAKLQGCFSSCWISHVLRKDVREFLRKLTNSFPIDSTICFIDSLFIEGGRKIYTRDSGDTYQKRTVTEGKDVEIVKNFYVEKDWKHLIEANELGKIIAYQEWKHYFMVAYKVNESWHNG